MGMPYEKLSTRAVLQTNWTIVKEVMVHVLGMGGRWKGSNQIAEQGRHSPRHLSARAALPEHRILEVGVPAPEGPLPDLDLFAEKWLDQCGDGRTNRLDLPNCPFQSES
jgi:hypothetical protein